MKIDFKYISSIKNLKELKNFKLDKPLYFNNYLFHYLIIFNKLDILKLYNFPIYKENDEEMNGFFLAAKYNNISILRYLIITYPDYIYNKNSKNEQFINYLNYKLIIKLLDLKLEWEKLFLQEVSENITIFDLILRNYKYENLLEILKVYKPTTHPLNFLLINKKISTENIINILKLFDSKVYNLRNNFDDNLIFITLYNKDSKLLSFLLKNNIEANYYSYYEFMTPLMYSYLYSNLEITKQLWDHIKNDFNYNNFNDDMENIAHFLLKNNFLDPVSLEILSNCPSSVWHQYNINKIPPLYLITNLNCNDYMKILIDKEINLDIKISKNNISLKKLLIKNKAFEWLDFLSKQKIYKEKNNVIIKDYPYTHSNIFQPNIYSILIIIIYFKNKYKNLYIPIIENYLIEDLFYNNNNYNYSNNKYINTSQFPWFMYFNIINDSLHAYNNINNLINITRREYKYDFAIIYLDIENKNGLHANILIYDFNKMTIERFDPWGNIDNREENLDNILEEELCWNTGFIYIKTSNYMQKAGFQMISNESYKYNIKSGDPGGFCLSWCFWYLEHRLINKNINQKELVIKLIKKISLKNLSFTEYIRNYANKLYTYYFNTLLKIGVDEKIISTSIYDNNTHDLIIKYINKNINKKIK